LSDQLARRTVLITVTYLLSTAALIALLGDRLSHQQGLVAAHLAVAAVLLIVHHHAAAARALEVIRDWHPLILFPVFYKEVEPLAAAFGDWRLTATIPALEASLFGGQPSLYLSERWPSVLLCEWLHFCYLSYPVIIPAVAAYWYVSQRRLAFQELLFLLATAMFGSYLFFMLFPVDSPYYLTPRLGAPLADNLFFDLVHSISSRGGARGGAFPSAHVTGAVVLWLVVWRHQRRLAVAMAPLVLGLMVATVYGRFHYVLDVVAGALVAVTAVSIGGTRAHPHHSEADSAAC
jgi:membrane-associated phospholipid phosphatase